MAKPPRLRQLDTVDLPVREASGLAVRRSGDDLRVSVVGDHSARLASARYSADGFGDWEVVDLAEFGPWGLSRNDSQLEAIADAGDGEVAVLLEDPPAVLVGDPATGRLRARIMLDVPSAFELDWADRRSRGEGLVLLRGSRLLVAKEKDRPALIEFAPLGSTALGVAADDLIGPGESWAAPAGTTEYEAVAVWRLEGEAAEALHDISALAPAERSLHLLSDRSRRLAALALDRGVLGPDGGTIGRLDGVWRLPKGVRDPEGIAHLGADRMLIALDHDERRRNGVVVAAPK